MKIQMCVLHTAVMLLVFILGKVYICHCNVIKNGKPDDQDKPRSTNHVQLKAGTVKWV